MTDQLLQLPTKERREVYQAAAAELALPEAIVEKDVWICWVLNALFSAPGQLPMAFKGGTSLSKAYQAIYRFSEDVDLTIGFDELSKPLPASRKQRDILKDELSQRVADHVSQHVVPLLIERLTDEFGIGNEAVELDDKETVVLDYPSCFAKSGGYIFERVRIEFGGRNSIEPNDTVELTALAASLGYDVEFPRATVDVLSPMRTFWEKATLAHDECGRPEWTHEGDRFARHWYDLAMLADHDIGRCALGDTTLLNDVLRVKQAFWVRKTSNYEACSIGGFRLIPDGDRVDHLRRDFEQMVSAGMFSIAPPPFAGIIERLRTLEQEINAILIGGGG